MDEYAADQPQETCMGFTYRNCEGPLNVHLSPGIVAFASVGSRACIAPTYAGTSGICLRGVSGGRCVRMSHGPRHQGRSSRLWPRCTRPDVRPSVRGMWVLVLRLPHQGPALCHITASTIDVSTAALHGRAPHSSAMTSASLRSRRSSFGGATCARICRALSPPHRHPRPRLTTAAGAGCSCRHIFQI